MPKLAMPREEPRTEAEQEDFESLVESVPVSTGTQEQEEKPYNPEMDPGSPLWQPIKYFKTQEKQRVFVLRDQSDQMKDPENKIPVMLYTSINGFGISVPMGKSSLVPRDFAAQLLENKRAQFVGDSDTDELVSF